MQTTGNLGLKKPEGTDVVNIDDINYNMDILDVEVTKRIVNAGGVPSAQAGPEADRPAPGTVGRLYIATDTRRIFIDTGTAWALIATVNPSDIPDGSITDAKIGNRTISDASAPTGDTGTVTTLFGWLASMIKAITGKSSWRTAPVKSIEQLNNEKVNRAGDIMTGLLTISQNGIYPTINANKSANASSSEYPDGISIMVVSASVGWPVNNGTVYTVIADRGIGQRIFQIFVQKEQNNIWLRTRNNDDTAWNPFVPIWTGENSGPFYRGSGSPEGKIAAPVGAIYQRTDGGAGSTFYIKESGTGNTGWRAV